jgi:hypothetical protein
VDVVGDSVYVQGVEPDGNVFDSFSIVKSIPTAVEITAFTASSEPEGIRLRWSASGAGLGFRIYRGPSEPQATYALNHGDPVLGGPDYSYLDRDAEPGRSYVYRIAALDASGHETWIASAQATRDAPRLGLRAPRPNPFERTASFSFTLPRSAQVRLTVTDIHGRRVRSLVSGDFPAGDHAAVWNGRDDRGREAASGIYFLTMEAGTSVVRTRVALLR